MAVTMWEIGIKTGMVEGDTLIDSAKSIMDDELKGSD